MELDFDSCERARLTRDPRFDGRFFTGVLTAGIYCRSICPAPSPNSANVVYFPSAAAARDAGLRPCLRCRPEAAPGSPAWVGTAATVTRALRLIHEGALDSGSVGQLADRLGIGERHLRKLFATHLGSSPLAVAQTRRIHFAKLLLDETSLPMTEIALSAGFGSLRRFNAVFKDLYGKAPSDLRNGRPARGSRACTLRLRYREPFAWSLFHDHFALRALPGVESVTPESYSRTVRFADYDGWITLRPCPSAPCLELTIGEPRPDVLARIVSRARRAFDLDADPAEITRHLSADPVLAACLERVPALRLPVAFDPFEQCVRAIIGQQVSVRAAATIAGRLVQRLGKQLVGAPPGVPNQLFPTAAELASLDLDGIGMPGKRVESVRRFASAVACGELPLDDAAPVELTLDRLRALPGIGPWTAQYIALRAFGDPDAFPASDLGLLQSSAWGGSPPTAAKLLDRAERWRPWRAYAAVLLWRAYAPSDRARIRARAPKLGRDRHDPGRPRA